MPPILQDQGQGQGAGADSEEELANQLASFYSVMAPENVPRARELAARYLDDERRLNSQLQQR